MAQPYTRRFAAAANLPGGVFTTLFTASSAWTWILRDLVVANGSGANVDIAIGIQAGPATYWLIRDQVLELFSTIHWDGRQEILPDESLVAYTGSPNALSVLATGYALTPAGA